MLKFHSTGERGTFQAEMHFPNKKGVHALKTKIGESDVFEVTELKTTTLMAYDLDCSTTVAVSETGFNEIVEKIRILSPD